MSDLEFTIVKNKFSNSMLYQIVNENEGQTLGYRVSVPCSLFRDESSIDSFAITCLCDQIRADLFASLK